ncbi:MAG: methionyl-tRNA formyltransferase [Gemmatimonadales bacterium]|nr:methionyl-tRNA formyltransferase [Gemmatimonadales bacterium]
MRLVFFGTPTFAARSLSALLDEGHDVAGVVTQPDRPHGRSRSTLVPPPVKALAVAKGIPVLQPERPVGDVFLASLRRLDATLGVVVAYGHILRPEVLAAPPAGMINVHASLLPRLRGAAPIQWAIANGDSETGVTVMQMEAGLDSGPMLHRLSTPIEPDDTAATLAERLADLGGTALVEALALFAAGAIRPEPQDHSRATFAPKITRESARVDWSADARVVARRIRAFDPAPGAWSTLDGADVKLFGARPVPLVTREPGSVLREENRVCVAAGVGAVELCEVQSAGRRRAPVEEWLRGRSTVAGARFM